MPAECSCSAHGGFLTAKGLREAAQRELELTEDLAVGSSRLYLDKVASVSALIEPSEPIWVDSLLIEQHRRFIHHGS